jgi:hypothetical protein
MMGDDVDFFVVMPFKSGAATIEIIDNETQKKVHEADVTKLVIDFCDKVNYTDPECLSFDLDNDGIPDAEDQCITSDMSAFIIINACGTGVRNKPVKNGCTMNDLIAQCAGSAKNHGKFVSCIANLTNGWKKDKIISEKEKGAIQKCAAKAKIP